MTLILKRLLGVLILLMAASYLVVQSSGQSLAHGDLSKQEMGNPPPQPLGGP